MSTAQKPALLKETYRLDPTITVNDAQTKLIVDLAFNNTNGQFTITSKVTTMQVSRDRVINEATAKRLAELIVQQMENGLKLRDDWGGTENDPNGPLLPFETGYQDEEPTYGTNGQGQEGGHGGSNGEMIYGFQDEGAGESMETDADEIDAAFENSIGTATAPTKKGKGKK
jgi:hypothetical protein